MSGENSSDADIKKAEKILLQEEVREHIEKWAKKRFWFIAILALVLSAIISGLGPAAIIQTVIGDRIDESIGKAAVTAYRANEQLNIAIELQENAKKLANTVESLSQDAKKIEEKLKEIDVEFEAKNQNIRSERKLIETGLQQQISNLEEIIKKISEDQKEFDKQIKTFTQKQKEIRENIIDNALVFESNSQYSIEIHYSRINSRSANDFIDGLRKKGFNVERWEDIPLGSILSKWNLSFNQIRTFPTIVFSSDVLLKQGIFIQEFDKMFQNPVYLKSNISNSKVLVLLGQEL